MKRYLSKFGSNLVALLLLAVMSLTALAGPRPFHLVEHGQLNVTPHDASGNVLDLVAEGVGTATHLGVITVQRTATLTAASGEQLTSTFTGTLNAGHADLVYEWTGGTGRFQQATGTTFWSVDVADGEYDVVATGQIVY